MQKLGFLKLISVRILAVRFPNSLSGFAKHVSDKRNRHKAHASHGISNGTSMRSPYELFSKVHWNPTSLHPIIGFVLTNHDMKWFPPTRSQRFWTMKSPHLPGMDNAILIASAAEVNIWVFLDCFHFKLAYPWKIMIARITQLIHHESITENWFTRIARCDSLTRLNLTRRAQRFEGSDRDLLIEGA